MKKKKLFPSIPKRYIIVLMIFLGYLNSSYLHTNVSMAIITMTSTQQRTLANGTISYVSPEFDWNSKEKAIILSSFNYGLFFGPFGGILAAKFGGATIYGISIAGMAIVTFTTPFLLRMHYVLYFLANFSIGVFESFFYACTTQLWSRWATPDERAKFISFSLIGAFVAPIVSFLVAGFILKRWNWSILYYVSGILTFVWYWIWFFLANNDPDEDRHISEQERNYIKEKIQHVSTNKLHYPWKKMLTSLPFLACCAAKFSLGCGSSFAFAYIPQFVKDVSNLEIDKIGYISTIPMICMVTSMPLWGYLADYIRKNKLMSLTNVHKLYISIGLFMGTIIFMIIRFWPTITTSIVCLSIQYFFLSSAYIDTLVLVLDLAPNFAGLLHSLANIFLSSAKIITPTIFGLVATNNSSSQWNTCFLIFGSIYLFSGCFFLIFGSGDIQPWAKHPESQKSKENES